MAGFVCKLLTTESPRKASTSKNCLLLKTIYTSDAFKHAYKHDANPLKPVTLCAMNDVPNVGIRSSFWTGGAKGPHPTTPHTPTPNKIWNTKN